MIPGSMNASRIAENFKSREVQLDAEDMERIRRANRDTRYLTVSEVLYGHF